MFFSFQFRKNVIRYKCVGYNLNVKRQPACLVFNQIIVDNYAAFFICTPEGRALGSMIAPTYGCSFWLVEAGASCLLLCPPGPSCFFFLMLRIFSEFVWHPGFSIARLLVVSVGPRF